MKTDRLRIGLLFQPGAVWLGVHWSNAHRRFCVNLIPFVTLWIALPGGVAPRERVAEHKPHCNVLHPNEPTGECDCKDDKVKLRREFVFALRNDIRKLFPDSPAVKELDEALRPAALRRPFYGPDFENGWTEHD